MRLLSKKEAAQLVGLHPESLMRLSREGKFPAAIKIGGTHGSAVRFDQDEIEAHLGAHRIAQRETAQP